MEEKVVRWKFEMEREMQMHEMERLKKKTAGGCGVSTDHMQLLQSFSAHLFKRRKITVKILYISHFFYS